MMPNLSERRGNAVVLIVDDAPENLAMLHDSLDESGFTVLVASNGEAALARARDTLPDIILLDAVMPGMDGFAVCRQLRAEIATRHIPVLFMTGLTETEHVLAAFQAGGTDYINKPLRQSEVVARIGAHLQTAQLMHQARSALDVFGNAVIAVTPDNWRIVWQTPLARQWMQRYLARENDGSDTPATLRAWLEAAAIGPVAPLSVAHGSSRVSFSIAGRGEQWMVVLREESDSAQLHALMALFKLTQREAEVLHWVTQGKTNRDIGDILGTSPRTVNKHLEHVFSKLNVETRTAAASLAMRKVRTALADMGAAA